jgi:hypothetical protein
MIFRAGVSPLYWDYAALYMVHILNRIPTNQMKDDECPYICWFWDTPSMITVRMFGCVCYAYVDSSCRDNKLDHRSRKGIYLDLVTSIMVYLSSY